MTSTTRFGLAVLALTTSLSCGGDKPLPKEPEAPPIELPKSDFEPVTSGPATEATPSDPNAESPSASLATRPSRSIREIVGQIATIEVRERGKKKLRLAKAADVDAFLSAVGMEQSPSGERRRCPDDVVVVLKGEDGGETGFIGVCRGEQLGAALWAPGVERAGFVVADEAAFKKATGIADKVPGAKPAREKKAAPKR